MQRLHIRQARMVIPLHSAPQAHLAALAYPITFGYLLTLGLLYKCVELSALMSHPLDSLVKLFYTDTGRCYVPSQKR